MDTVFLVAGYVVLVVVIIYCIYLHGVIRKLKRDHDDATWAHKKFGR
ncbi:hypothetical protein KC872_04740 [Candidatus Kaiserbacteria bacterium]|nr:hypothetical protein [Candidatus Kaiserbacteria bacterium]